MLGAFIVVAVVLLLVALGVRRLPARGVEGPEYALPAGTCAPLDRLFAPQLQAHAEESGFRVVVDGVEAFAVRAHSARWAQRSLDVQYYIWHDDLTGGLLIRELLQAADRGVRVRLLLDDLDARANHFELAALDAHPNIAVRIFNPFASRSGWAGKVIEGVLNFSRINGRMHNKNWIADNRVAISGGRNIADEYFSASDRLNFIDVDFAVLGRAVSALSATFDAYWNSAAVWPIAALNRRLVDQAQYHALRAAEERKFQRALQSNYVQALVESRAFERLVDPSFIHWSRRWEVLSDDPMKARVAAVPQLRSAVFRGLAAALNGAARTITLATPYFVPGTRGTAELTNLARAGIALSILTNSLAATDVAAVHGGYAKYRDALLASGIALWELKPDEVQGAHHVHLFGSSGASLHTKAAIVDGQLVFIGSFNLDPRSVSLNCEQGVLVHDVPLATRVDALFAAIKRGEHAWRVTHDRDGRLQWSDDQQTLTREPDASMARRVLARAVGMLPIESQL